MLVYIDDSENEKLDDGEWSSNSYGYDYGDEEELYDYVEIEDSYFYDDIS